jgi:hypothetical protein
MGLHRPEYYEACHGSFPKESCRPLVLVVHGLPLVPITQVLDPAFQLMNANVPFLAREHHGSPWGRGRTVSPLVSWVLPGTVTVTATSSSAKDNNSVFQTLSVSLAVCQCHYTEIALPLEAHAPAGFKLEVRMRGI